MKVSMVTRSNPRSSNYSRLYTSCGSDSKLTSSKHNRPSTRSNTQSRSQSRSQRRRVHLEIAGSGTFGLRAKRASKLEMASKSPPGTLLFRSHHPYNQTSEAHPSEAHCDWQQQAQSHKGQVQSTRDQHGSSQITPLSRLRSRILHCSPVSALTNHRCEMLCTLSEQP